MGLVAKPRPEFMWQKGHVDMVSSIPKEQKGLGKASEEAQTRQGLDHKREATGREGARRHFQPMLIFKEISSIYSCC